jgi:hypothetical protein
MKLTFGAKTLSGCWTFLSRTLAGGNPLRKVVGRTAAGQVVPVGVAQAGQVARPWGAAASTVYLPGAAEGELYA